MRLVGAPGTKGMTAPIVSPWKTPPGAGKFEEAYAWPLISGSVFRIQSAPTLVGAACPKNVIDVKAVQLSNAFFPIDVTLLGMLTEVREVQLKNAYHSMDVTLSGMVSAPAFAPGHWIKVVTVLLYSTPSMLA
jgi:hypothetical protein